MIPDDRTLEALANSSREFRLACSADGAIRWVDDRVARLFDAARGDDLRDRIAPGCAAKLEDFLSRGRREPVTSCELPFVVPAGRAPLRSRRRQSRMARRARHAVVVSSGSGQPSCRACEPPPIMVGVPAQQQLALG